MALLLRPTFSWAIFRGGSILNNIRAKNAAEQAALLSFEQTVLTATKNPRRARGLSGENRYDALTKVKSVRPRSHPHFQDLYKNGLGLQQRSRCPALALLS